MRLSLFDRLRRFARWRVGTRASSRDRKHRKGKVQSPRPVATQRQHAGISQQHSADPSPWERTAQVPPWERSPGPAPQPPASRTGVPPSNGPGHPGAGPGSYPGLAMNYDGSSDHRAAGGAERPAGIGGGAGRARIREAPFGVAPVESARVSQEVPRQAQTAARQPWYHVVGGPAAAARQPPGQMRPIDAAGLADRTGLADVAGLADATGLADTAGLAASRPGTANPAEPVGPARTMRAALPFAAPHPQGHPPTADGRRNCGPLEAILWRQWDEAATPPLELVAAVERLAEFPRQLKEKLAAGLDAIYLGPGGVPELDDMTSLRGVPLPSGRATWDACAGAYGERKIIVGSRPSPTPDVMCHEVGHALDDLDSSPGKWQSDSAEFRLIYDQCQPYIASDFHRQRGGLGRKEFFADAFAAIASGQRPALVDMLDGNTRIALRVMLYFNRRYGI
jgi:hypothetical protein